MGEEGPEETLNILAYFQLEEEGQPQASSVPPFLGFLSFLEKSSLVCLPTHLQSTP